MFLACRHCVVVFRCSCSPGPADTDAARAVSHICDKSVVTEMRPIKHPYSEGIRAQKGVEFDNSPGKHLAGTRTHKQ
ncbi:MAG TPA: cob(I)yrinic acid a,c-diamide adenosyltransferase [Candidatus Binatia bacterium]|nr:cob(I)yrinic acid a,c-diamide adenosyltransferase [Candidatus Binatia bacterium]